MGCRVWLGHRAWGQSCVSGYPSTALVLSLMPSRRPTLRCWTPPLCGQQNPLWVRSEADIRLPVNDTAGRNNPIIIRSGRWAYRAELPNAFCATRMGWNGPLRLFERKLIAKGKEMAHQPPCASGLDNPDQGRFGRGWLLHKQQYPRRLRPKAPVPHRSCRKAYWHEQILPTK